MNRTFDKLDDLLKIELEAWQHGIQHKYLNILKKCIDRIETDRADGTPTTRIAALYHELHQEELKAWKRKIPRTYLKIVKKCIDEELTKEAEEKKKAKKVARRKKRVDDEEQKVNEKRAEKNAKRVAEAAKREGEEKEKEEEEEEHKEEVDEEQKEEVEEEHKEEVKAEFDFTSDSDEKEGAGLEKDREEVDLVSDSEGEEEKKSSESDDEVTNLVRDDEVTNVGGKCGFTWEKNSCFVDHLLVAMFATTTAFDFIFDDPLKLKTFGTMKFAKELKTIIKTMRGNSREKSCTTFRADTLGGVWTDGQYQSMSTLYHEIIGRLNAKLFKRIHSRRWPSVYQINMTRGDNSVDTNKVQLITGISPVFVVDVARDSTYHKNYVTDFFKYGDPDYEGGYVLNFPSVDSNGVGKSGLVSYLLTGIVCHRDGHYLAYMRDRLKTWYFYNDLTRIYTKVPDMEKIRTKDNPHYCGAKFFYVKERYGFKWVNNSCYIDSLIVAMFYTTTAFDFIFKNKSTVNLSGFLKSTVERLRANKVEGTTCSTIRDKLGGEWDENLMKASDEVLEKILQDLKIPGLFKITAIEFVQEGSRVLEAQSGTLLTLNIFDSPLVEHIFEETAQNQYILHFAESKVFVCTVNRVQRILSDGRPVTDNKIECNYGDNLDDGSFVLTLKTPEKYQYLSTNGDKTAKYLLTGVVCHHGGNHYVAYMWDKRIKQWYFYDDINNNAKIVQINSLRASQYPPEFYGQMFFYELQEIL